MASDYIICSELMSTCAFNCRENHARAATFSVRHKGGLLRAIWASPRGAHEPSNHHPHCSHTHGHSPGVSQWSVQCQQGHQEQPDRGQSLRHEFLFYWLHWPVILSKLSPHVLLFALTWTAHDKDVCPFQSTLSLRSSTPRPSPAPSPRPSPRLERKESTRSTRSWLSRFRSKDDNKSLVDSQSESEDGEDENKKRFLFGRRSSMNNYRSEKLFKEVHFCYHNLFPINLLHCNEFQTIESPMYNAVLCFHYRWTSLH